VNLLGLAQPVPPAWEPDQGWRVLDPDCHLVSVGGKTIIEVHIEFGQLFGADGHPLPMPGQDLHE
jgi:hypothetical protein